MFVYAFEHWARKSKSKLKIPRLEEEYRCKGQSTHKWKMSIIFCVGTCSHTLVDSVSPTSLCTSAPKKMRDETEKSERGRIENNFAIVLSGWSIVSRFPFQRPMSLHPMTTTFATRTSIILYASLLLWGGGNHGPGINVDNVECLSPKGDDLSLWEHRISLPPSGKTWIPGSLSDKCRYYVCGSYVSSQSRPQEKVCVRVSGCRWSFLPGLKFQAPPP